jgi:aquaporin Z
MFAGPVSGASMNPARSLGPALMSMNLSHLWIYLVATIAGAGFAVALDFLLSIGIEKSSDSEKTKRS